MPLSDHNGLLAVPVSNIEVTKTTSKDIKFVRPIPESSIVEFSQSIDATNWPLIMDSFSSRDGGHLPEDNY